MGVKMEFTMLILCVIPALVTPITVSTNGNSPKTRMVGGMMTNTEEGFVPMTPEVETTTQSNYEKSRTLNTNVTELSINERYRRLIPYMTFYYANDLTNPSTVKTTNVEVEKAEIIEQRQPKKIVYSSQRNIPRYQGNRLTQYNIASANPTKIFYKDGVAYHQNPKVSPNANPFVGDTHEYEFGRFKPKHPVGFRSATRKPFYNLYNEETPNIRYYLSEKEPSLKYKLIPYEQTPPVKVPSYEQPQFNPYKHTPSKISPYEQSPSKISPYEQSPSKIIPYEQRPSKISPYEQSPVKTNIYDSLPVDFAYDQTPVKVVPYEQPPPVKMPSNEPSSHAELPQKENNYEPRRPVLVSVLVPKDLYDKPRPVRPPFFYEGASEPVRKQSSIVSESYYEKQPQQLLTEPVVESGFQPIAPPVGYTTEQPIHKTTAAATKVTLYDIEDSDEKHEDKPDVPEHEVQPNYYQYEADQPKSKPPQMMSNPNSLASLLNSLQVNKAIPKPITTNNVGSSIQTLLHFLNNLKAKQDGTPLLSTPKPFLPQNVLVKVPPKPELLVSRRPEVSPAGLQDEHILADVETPSQHLDDHATYGGSSQQFPLPTYSDDDGGTPGRPGVDYPILTIIPPTSFDCKTQRYKGFFADTETRCQVWHYCDLNGGQASFLCPNGTIFSQAGLTCDWWFNVKCSNTPQLYVLNESLYKFILPHSPKFPEDYSGPLVDKYLTLKFKEMEEEFKKNKNKNAADEPKEEEEEEDDEDNMKKQTEHDKRQLYELSEASVIVESPGTSGKVQRLIDEYK